MVSVLRLTSPVRATIDDMGEIIAYLEDIEGSISSSGNAGTLIGSYTYADGAIRFYSNTKVKSGILGSADVTKGELPI